MQKDRPAAHRLRNRPSQRLLRNEQTLSVRGRYVTARWLSEPRSPTFGAAFAFAAWRRWRRRMLECECLADSWAAA